MRLASLSLGVLVLAACGASEPRVALPLEAPTNAHPLVKDFIDICSLAIDQPVKASALAKERGWILEGGTGGVSAFQNPEIDGMLQIMAFDYPHIESKSCMINITGDIPDDLELAQIGDIQGVQGEVLQLRDPTSAMNEAVSSGRWSFISEADLVVTITTTEMPSLFASLNMSTARRVTPEKN